MGENTNLLLVIVVGIAVWLYATRNKSGAAAGGEEISTPISQTGGGISTPVNAQQPTSSNIPYSVSTPQGGGPSSGSIVLNVAGGTGLGGSSVATGGQAVATGGSVVSNISSIQTPKSTPVEAVANICGSGGVYIPGKGCIYGTSLKA